MFSKKSLTVRQPRFWAEIAIIVMILLIWSDIGSVVATYLTVCWSHLFLAGDAGDASDGNGFNVFNDWPKVSFWLF